MVAPVELVRSVLTEDWSDDYAASITGASTGMP